MSNSFSNSNDQASGRPALSNAQAIRGMQIVTGALCMGPLIFIGISLAINSGDIDGTPNVLSYIGLGMACLMTVNHLIVSRIMKRAALKKIDSQELKNADNDEKKISLILPAYQCPHIIACAILEGAAFVNIVAYMTEPFFGNLIAAVVLVTFIALRIPTTTKVTFWAQDRIREIEMT